MTVPNVPSQDPGQSTIILPHITSAHSPWYTSQAITDIPSDAVGWLVAQGWDVLAVSYDNTTTPPTPYYNLGRESLLNWAILQDLLNAYTIAYNEARDCNSVRYNEVITNWTAMLASSHQHFNSEVSEENVWATAYLSTLNYIVGDLDFLILENRNQVAADAVVGTAALAAMDTKLPELESNYDSHEAIVGALLVDQASYLSTFLSNFAAKLTELDSNYAGHVVEIGTLLSNARSQLEAFVADQDKQLTDLAKERSATSIDIARLINAEATSLATHLAQYAAKMDDGEAHGATTRAEVEALLAGEVNSLASHIASYVVERDTAGPHGDTTRAAVEASITDRSNRLATYLADYAAAIGLLATDYTAHVPVATAFLTNLGATETARINEKWSSNLTEQRQLLIDRGLYSSAIVVDITARNTRDRDEEIQALNDRLMREKFENQHRLYEQQFQMRLKGAEAEDRKHAVYQDVTASTATVRQQLHEQFLSEVKLVLDAMDRQRTATADVARHGAATKQQLQEELMGEVKLILDSLDRERAATQSVAQFATATEERLFAAVQSVIGATLDGLEKKHALSVDVWRAEQTQRDRLLDQIQGIVAQHLAGLERQHGSQQDVSRFATTERDRLLEAIQDAVKSIVSGKERFAAMTMQNSAMLAENRHKIVAEKMTEHMAHLDGLIKTHEYAMNLMARQLEIRNQILVGLYGFVERREDVAPTIEQLAKICTSLGDAGGGWVTP